MNRLHASLLFVLMIHTFIALGSLAHAGDRWPAFQGARVADLAETDLPLQWSPEEHIAWKTALTGYGQSSPVVWGERVFVTTISGAMKENCHVAAFDRKSGDQLWKRDFAAASQAENNNYVSKAAPTPVVDPQNLVVLFEGGNLICLSHDGEIRWQRNLIEQHGAIQARHGLGSSLEQNDEHVFVWIERQAEPYLLAVSKSSGETIWKQPGLGVTSWSSPRLVPLSEAAGGGTHLVLSGIGKLAGYDPESGERLWEFDDISGNSTPTPVPVGEGRFLIGATEGRGQAGGGNAAESNGLLQITEAEDGKFQVQYVWQARRATSSFGSPIAHQGYAYFVNRAGVVYCLDLETGEEQYAQRVADSVWATPLAVGNRIYFFGRRGTTTVIQAGPKFKELAENKLWEEGQPQAAQDEPAGGGGFGGPVLYAVAAVGSELILRRGDVLYSIEK